MISAEQLRGARAMLRWEQTTVAKKANVSVETVKRLERLSGPLEAARGATVDVIRRAFEEAGIEFLEPQANVAGAGVRLKWGTEVPGRAVGTGTGEGGVGSKALDHEMAEHWAAHPERWAALPEIGRHVLSNEMFGSPEAADEAFGNDAR